MSLDCATEWVAEQLGRTPSRADASLILRHAEREDIPAGTFGVDVPVTAHGIESADRLGATLSRIRSRIGVTTSPVPRCVSTAKAILRGGGRPEEVALDWRLGDPGPFVIDEEAAGALFLNVGILEIVRRQLCDAKPPAGMRPTAEGVELLLELTSSHLRHGDYLNIYVTHDAILAVLVAHMYKLQVGDVSWPGYLDGLLMWRSGERLHFGWRGLEQGSHPLGGERDRFSG